MSEQDSFITRLNGVSVEVEYKIFFDLRTVCKFYFNGKSQLFEIKTWRRWTWWGFPNFVRKFYQDHNDADRYGTILDGDIVNPSYEQQLAIVKKAILDCFRYLDQLLSTQGRLIVDYAMWYRETHGEELNTYSDYIQIATCNCIIQSRFLAPNVAWVKVPFNKS